MRRSLLQAVVLPAAFAVLTAGSPAKAGTVLISADEAKLPPPKGAVSVASRGITRGPKIELIGSADNVKSPMHLALKFESFGGAKIWARRLKAFQICVEFELPCGHSGQHAR